MKKVSNFGRSVKKTTSTSPKEEEASSSTRSPTMTLPKTGRKRKTDFVANDDEEKSSTYNDLLHIKAMKPDEIKKMLSFSDDETDPSSQVGTSENSQSLTAKDNSESLTATDNSESLTATDNSEYSQTTMDALFEDPDEFFASDGNIGGDDNDVTLTPAANEGGEDRTLHGVDANDVTEKPAANEGGEDRTHGSGAASSNLTLTPADKTSSERRFPTDPFYLDLCDKLCVKAIFENRKLLQLNKRITPLSETEWNLIVYTIAKTASSTDVWPIQSNFTDYAVVIRHYLMQFPWGVYVDQANVKRTHPQKDAVYQKLRHRHNSFKNKLVKRTEEDQLKSLVTAQKRSSFADRIIEAGSSCKFHYS